MALASRSSKYQLIEIAGDVEAQRVANTKLFKIVQPCALRALNICVQSGGLKNEKR
jgi:hypothetical protein